MKNRALPSDAKLTIQCRVRHPRRDQTIEYWTINARQQNGVRTQTLGDFGRFTDRAAARAALSSARLDIRTSQATAFATFAGLVAAPYTPTLADSVLADAYDAAQAAAGCDKRAARRS